MAEKKVEYRFIGDDEVKGGRKIGRISVSGVRWYLREKTYNVKKKRQPMR